MNRIILLLFFCGLFFCKIDFCAAQVSTSKYEKHWAMRHPIAAIKVKRIYKRAKFHLINMWELKYKLDTFSVDGKLDAFRHIYYMAAFAQKVKPSKVRKLGIAHEKTNYLQYMKGRGSGEILPDSMSSVMDLLNNDIGIRLGRENRKLNYKELKNLVIQHILDGNGYYMLFDEKGNYLACDGKTVINRKQYVNDWYVPKCMLGLKTVQISD